MSGETKTQIMGRAVVKGLRVMRSYITRNTERGTVLAECQKDAWFTEEVAREIGCNLPVIPGSHDYWSKFYPFMDLYFDGIVSEYVVRFLSSYESLARDICDVLESSIRSLGYITMSNTPNDRNSSFYYWITLVSQDRWVQVMKYHKDWLFVHYADLFNREYPEPPSFPIHKPGSLFFGGQDRFLKKHLRSKNLVVLNTVLQGIKKGMQPVSDDLVLQSAKKHARILTTRPQPLCAEVEEAIRRTSKEVFGVIGREDIRIADNEAMSSHSCVESVRSQKGFNGYWLRETYGRDSDVIFGYMRDFQYATDFVGFGTRGGLVITEFRCPSDRVSDSCIDRALLAYTSETRSPVRVKFILEPLKVRTISCGSYEAYSCQKPLQKLLWSRMQRFSTFILTGTSIDCGIMQKVVAGKWEDDDLLVSGDYSSATDLLSMDATILAMQSCMTGPVLKIAAQALGPQLLQYYGPNWICKNGLEDRKSELPKPCWQANGQLMGSPLSFPFLCVINAAIFRMAYELWHGVKVSLDSLPLLINGDDIGFRGSWEFYQYWRHCIQLVGFQPSVGKNFTSKSFININSQYFDCKQIGDLHYVDRRIPYVNMGIITGRKKGDTLDDIGFDSDKIDILIQLQSASQNVKELLDGHDTYRQTIYQEWKLWNSELQEKYPVGFFSSGLKTEIGPSTCSEARLGYHLSKVQYGRIKQPQWMGDDSNTVMGSYWKPFVQFHSEMDVINDIDQAVYRWRRSKSHKGQVPVETPQPLNNEIIMGRTSWSELVSRAAMWSEMDCLLN